MAYGYITELSKQVHRDHIKFHNRYNTTLAGDLYYAKDIDKHQQLPAPDRRCPIRRGKGTGPGRLR